jgi:hypothetical protein
MIVSGARRFGVLAKRRLLAVIVIAGVIVGALRLGRETMYRRALAAAVVAAVCVGAVASTAGAIPGNGATVIRGDVGTCFTADNTGSWVFTCKAQVVIQPGGTITQYLAGSVITDQSSPLPSRAVTDITTADNGLPCLVLDGQVITTVVAGVVTPSGQVRLTCRS